MNSQSTPLINTIPANAATMMTPESKPVVSSGHATIPDLIWPLRSSFLASDFDSVQQVLISREAEMMGRLNEMQMEVEKRRNDCDLMEKKHGELALAKMEIEDELNKCKIECDELKEKVTRFNEEQRICTDKEKLYADRVRRAEERYVKLLDEFDKKECERKEMILKLRNETVELKGAKSKAEAEVEAWKRKVSELDSRVLRLEKDTAMILEKDPVLWRTIAEHGLGLEGLRPGQMLGEKESALNEKPVVEVCAANGTPQLVHAHTKACFSVVRDNIDTTPGAISTCHSPAKANNGLEEDPHLLGVDCEDKGPDRKQFLFEAGGPDKMIASSSATNRKSRSRFAEVIDISDDDAELPMSLRSTSVRCDSNICASEIVLGEKEKISQKFLEHRHSNKSGEEKGRNCTDNALVSPTSKRKRTPSLDTSDNDDDGIPIGKHKTRQIKDLTVDAKASPVGQLNLVFIRQCGEKAEAKHNCGGLSSSSDSDSSVSGDDCSDSFLDNLIASLRSNRAHKSWAFEADMIREFERDPELCMNAVCTLYRQQVAVQSVKGSSYLKDRGFDQFDALRGTSLAKFLTNGDPHYKLKKSVAELRQYDPEALDNCRKLAKRYSSQLFDIYQKEEDPFFHPSHKNC